MTTDIFQRSTPYGNPADGVRLGYVDPSQFSALNVNNMRPHQEDPRIRQAYPLQINSFLRKDEWEEMDMAIKDVARTRLVLANDLVGLGLIKRLRGLGTMFASYQQQSDMADATIDMSGDTASSLDRLNYETISVPIPVIHKGFTISLRELEASRQNGNGLDAVHAMTAARKVNDAIEALIANGTGAPTVGGNTIQGLTNKTSRIADTATNFGGGDFATEGNGYKTINGMISQLQARGFFGPYVCYVARTQHGELRDRHTDGSGRSELAVIEENLRSAGLLWVKACDALAAGSLVVYEASMDVIDLAIGQDIAVVQWSPNGGMSTHYKVMAALAPRVKGNSTTTVGLAHATGA